MHSLNPAKPGQILTASHWLSLGWCWVLKFVCSFSIPQSRADFLCILTSCLQRIYSQLLGACTRSWPWGRRCVSESYGALGVPMGYFGGICKWGISSGLWAGFQMDSMKWLVGYVSLHALLEPCLLFSQPLPTSQSCGSPQDSGWGKKEVDLFS